MIPVNIDNVVSFGQQSTPEKFRILLSFIREYVAENLYYGHDTTTVDRPVSSFINEWLDNNEIERLELCEFNISLKRLGHRAPNLMNDLRWFVDSQWTWHVHGGRVNLRAFYNSLSTMFKHPDYVSRLRLILQKRGYQMIGSGAYSEVWGRPGDEWVYKINRGEDDGWCEYIIWALINGYCSTYAPKIQSLRKFNGFYVAKMQKLSKTMKQFRQDIDDSPKTKREYMLFDSVRNSAWNHSMEKIDRTTASQSEERFPGLIAFFTALIKEFGNGALDFHDGNFMVDDLGFVVVTDPIVSSNFSTSSAARVKNGRVLTAAA